MSGVMAKGCFRLALRKWWKGSAISYWGEGCFPSLGHLERRLQEVELSPGPSACLWGRGREGWP